ncbi:MAG: hypothetical protein Q9N26_04640 [Aquificota bacterium]|nr:hypothetical protein [Aquificota bacterium]
MMFLESCGVKKPPKPPPYPEFQVKRIGDLVYVIPKGREVVVKGFVKGEGFWYRKEEGRFCFKVSHRRGRSVLSCVEGKVTGKPEVEVRVLEDRVVIRARGFEGYRVYPVMDELIPIEVARFRNETTLRREHTLRRYGITGVVRGAETEPVIVEVPPLEPPVPDPPEDLSYTVRGNRIVIFWRWEEGVSYLVYRGDKLLTEKPIKTNVFVDDLPPRVTVYRVVAVNRFGKRSRPAVIVYRP